MMDFKKQHTMIAIVVDEYGGTAGLVAVETFWRRKPWTTVQDEYDTEEAETDPLRGLLAEGSAGSGGRVRGLRHASAPSEEEFDTVAAYGIADRWAAFRKR